MRFVDLEEISSPPVSQKCRMYGKLLHSLGPEGVDVGGVEVKLYLYVDDAVLLTRSRQELQRGRVRLRMYCD